jgi:hypothetical protein
LLFWFYRDLTVCENRLRMWRRQNPGVPVYGLYGGPLEERAEFAASLAPYLDDFWAFPLDRDSQWKWRNGDLMLRSWFIEKGHALQWDSVFVAQWDLIAVGSLGTLLPPMQKGDMLLSGLRPVQEVMAWWQWTQGKYRADYEVFMAQISASFGEVKNPMVCQFIGLVAPRQFLSRYGEIEIPELGFLEYRVPVYAQVFGTPLVPDTCFRPWWAEEPATAHVNRSAKLMHAWKSQVRLPMMLLEAHRPGGRRVFHPYREVYPHDLKSLAERARHARQGA